MLQIMLSLMDRRPRQTAVRRDGITVEVMLNWSAKHVAFIAIIILFSLDFPNVLQYLVLRQLRTEESK